MNAEQLQTIGIAAGYDIRLYKNMALSYDDRLGNVEWNPETNAEQTLMVLEWLEELDVRIEMQRFPGIWYIEIWNKETENIKQINNSDFQTAVCIAALAYVDHVN